MSILSLFSLNPAQQQAALADARAIAVTAGAGSGKTRTLTARYLRLLEQNHPLRGLIAITFTEKAAREMRGRIRSHIQEWLEQAEEGDHRRRWEQAAVSLDAARIGTIHSLCAEILRSHPVEAGVDPMFEVLEENTAALLKARARDETLFWAVDDAECVRLFQFMPERDLRQTLAMLLDMRLDADEAFRVMGDDPAAFWAAQLATWFDPRLDHEPWRAALRDLAALQARDPSDKMEQARRQTLAAWEDVQAARARGDWDGVRTGLATMRGAMNPRGGRKNAWRGPDLDAARAAMRALKDHYDAHLKPLLGDARGFPLWALDQRAAQLMPAFHRLFRHALRVYEAMKEERHALDFDDLEAKAAALLRDHPQVRRRWRANVAAVLVDEFQDTNRRQQSIIRHLTGFDQNPDDRDRPSLFIVGDAKQSIYRFRGADVTVFRETQAQIRQNRGLSIDLDLTYRGHRPLVETLNALLQPILGDPDPDRPHHIPFAPLDAHRADPDPRFRPPFLEFHLGLGDNAAQGRAAAAAGLADRLRQLHDDGVHWREMALLFRASTTFPIYEDALEQAGVPFVTVAGRGFYDRPEIRDLLNALAAIADPTDDLALAGLLRSPMFGLSDAALYLLRWGDPPSRDPIPLWQALADPSALDPDDQRQARRARDIVQELHHEAGRVRVAEIIKRLLDATYYQAILQAAPAAARAWRNIDKLLADAHRSQLVSIDDFLDYVQSLRDVAAREGEAPADAGDAVQLMTVHKAKGLEFPVVVIADAGYRRPFGRDALLIDRDLGLLLAVKDPDHPAASPFMFRLAQARNRDREDAETRRLLYVAATRAREKLLISGHAKISTCQGQNSLRLEGWLRALGEVVGLDEIKLPESRRNPPTGALPWNDHAARLDLYTTSEPLSTPTPIAPSNPNPDPLPPLDLVPPLVPSPLRPLADSRPRPLHRTVRKTKRGYAPHWLIGDLVHRALQLWRFPDDPALPAILETFARENGLVAADEIRFAVDQALRHLGRFQKHPLFQKLDRSQRLHEWPYAVTIDGQPETGVIDLLARAAADAHWEIYDFKTDYLKADADLTAHITGRIRPSNSALHPGRPTTSRLPSPLLARFSKCREPGQTDPVSVDGTQ